MDLSKGTGSKGDAEGDILSEVENLVGSGYMDLLTGDFRANHLRGIAGNDGLFGLEGNDTLVGGSGLDMLLGGDDEDELHGNDDNDIVSGEAGFDALFGDAGADELFGGEGNDDLYGGVGNDTLTGGADVDQLWGEDGADVFKFHTRDAYIVNMYYDRVEDFEVGIDKVDLSEFDIALTIPETPLGKPGEVIFEGSTMTNG